LQVAIMENSASKSNEIQGKSTKYKLNHILAKKVALQKTKTVKK